MITEVEDYFTKGCGRCERFDTPDCSTRRWIDDINALRALLLSEGLSEHVKWGHPTYMHADRNVAILGAFREDHRLTFMDGALLDDPEQLLEPAGPNSQHPTLIRFTALGQVAEREDAIMAYVREAMKNAERGLRAPQEKREVELPEELVEALASDPELSEAFDALTPGRRKSWAIQIGSAKQAKTRAARAAKARDKILAGKGALEY
ncbi:YdeI/OmpD-associated family protein [Yimella sp. cx-51]|uniref:YdeI/OmpD-associated family protein n=1 Tax=Yimella sp. cx-51 TaxID=2770551 RepID=UPI00165EAC46|nr:YdeI/OmpD-associated family protein [Yimella sp. cx-51]MBC9955450.1 YdeI/OmpD-associated family protein [Yimella sp. cx-51]QTH37960.1 YdeI/OmpD-associated family protein [Yimella sp. cx-51]